MPCVVTEQSGGVIFEVKHGPYAPFRQEDFAAWSPAPEDSACHALLDWYRDAAIGERWPANRR